jgi:hypothetical protein
MLALDRCGVVVSELVRVPRVLAGANWRLARSLSRLLPTKLREALGKLEFRQGQRGSQSAPSSPVCAIV